MSTKLHNGYRLTGPAADLDTVAMGLRQVFLPLMEREILAEGIANATRMWDLHKDGRTPEGLEGTSPIGAATREFIENAREERSSPGGRSQFGCDVVFFTDPETGGRLALLFAQRNTYRTAFESISGVEPWPYWDNTDRPDDVSEAEWEERRDTWDRVLPFGTAPSTVGLSWSLLGLYDEPLLVHLVKDHPDIATECIPIVERRAATVAFSRIVSGAAPDSVTKWSDLITMSERAEQLAPEVIPTIDPVTLDDLCTVVPKPDSEAGSS